MEPRRIKTTRRRRSGRLLDFLWLVLPTITLICVAAYFVGALVLRVNPPALAIANQAMTPAIKQGDLAIIQGVDKRTLKPGQVIAIKLTAPEEARYGLPGEIVRRIVKISRSNNTELFLTKGDGNPANDPFSVTPSAISGRVIGAIPLLGYPILFFSSKQGIFFLLATAFILLIYYILGFLEDRRHYAHATAANIQNVLDMVGYVHDAVQENHGLSLEKLVIPGLETKNALPKLELDNNEVIHEAADENEKHETIPSSHISELKDNPELRKGLKAILLQSIELRQAAEWLSIGDVSTDVMIELMGRSVTAIENLVIAIGDEELLTLLGQSKAGSKPLPPPPDTPAPRGFAKSLDNAEDRLEIQGLDANADGNSGAVGSSDPKSRDDTQEPTQSLAEITNPGSQDSADEAITERNDAIFTDRMHSEELPEEQEQLEFFQNYEPLANVADNEFMKDGEVTETNQGHSALIKRHRRRSLRRRD